MRSSSDLFPVRLVSAEVHGQFYEDAYLLKPNNSPDQTVELAVTRYSQHNDNNTRVPLILLHGFFSNRLEWLPFPGMGLASYFCGLGYDVWLPEMRGHGLSPVNKSYLHTGFSDYIQYDLPAICQFVTEKTGKKPVWVGHNFGGLSISASLGTGAIASHEVSGLILFSTRVGYFQQVINFPLPARIEAWLIGRQPFIEGYKSGYGQENEPGQLVSEVVKWQTLEEWRSVSGVDYTAAVKNVHCPVLALAPTLVRPENQLCYERFFHSLGSSKKTLETLPISDKGVISRKLHSFLLDQKNIEVVGSKSVEWLSENSHFDDDKPEGNGARKDGKTNLVA